MAEGLLTIGASASGSGLAAGMQKLMGGDQGNSVGSEIEDQINSMNKKLMQSLQNGLNYNSQYTNQAINTQQNYLGQGVNALTNALNTMTGQTQNTLTSGFNQSQALQSPYALMGYNAADAYADSLGLARPKMGSANMAQQMNTAATAINPQLIEQLKSAATAAGQDAWSQGKAPAAFVDPRQSMGQLMGALSPEQQAILNNPYLANFNAVKGQPGAMAAMVARGFNPNDIRTQAAQQLQLKQQLAGQQASQNSQYTSAMADYQNKQNLYGNYQGAQQSLLNSLQGLSPEQLKTALAYRSGSFNTPQVI